MRSMKNKLKAILYVPLVSLFLLFGFLPLQSVHAQGIPMDHDMSGPSSSAKNCCGSSSSVATLKEEENLPFYEQDDEPEPPQVPYFTEFNVFTVPRKLASSYLGGERVLRPPDLVILYANFRF